MLLIGMVLAGMAGSVLAGTYGGGSGTPEDPYQMATPEHLIALGQTPDDYDKCFVLTADIDLSGHVFDRAVIAPDEDDTEEWFQGTAFTGVFEGGGYKILNLKIEGCYFLGLFGNVESGTISNLGLEAVDVYGTGDYVGGLCGFHGWAYGSLFSHCYDTGIVVGNECVGGLVGYNEGDITASYSTGTVNGQNEIGGLVGTNSGHITTSHSVSTVTGQYNVGGLAGVGVGGEGAISTITNCYAIATVAGNESVGGLVGNNNASSSITGCYSDGEVTGNSSIGGLVGFNFGGESWGGNELLRSYSRSTVIGNEGVGGLVGTVGYGGPITACYSSGTVSGTNYVGGLIGSNDWNFGTITACYSTGEVSGTNYVGGLIGSNDWLGTITACYSIGTVSGQGQHVGGLAGSIWDWTITASFWDVETSGLTNGVGNEDPDPNGITGLTTSQMKTLSPFTNANWDFVNVWDIGENQTYPYLRTYSAADINKDHIVNIFDLAIMCEQWLETETGCGEDGIDWSDARCIPYFCRVFGC